MNFDPLNIRDNDRNFNQSQRVDEYPKFSSTNYQQEMMSGENMYNESLSHQNAYYGVVSQEIRDYLNPISCSIDNTPGSPSNSYDQNHH